MENIIFNCPKCEQELEVDSSGAGTEITCPSCEEAIVIPKQGSPGTRTSTETFTEGAAPAGVSAMASSAAAKIERHLKVPVRSEPTESLIVKPLVPLEAAAKDTDKKIRVKTIRHTDCVEVGHDRFDEFVTNFLMKVGESNIISINAINYSNLDIGSQKLMTEYGVLIVYKG